MSNSRGSIGIGITVMAATLASAGPGPLDGKSFQGRIAWSCDGNHNDEDDWAASAVALAIFAESGVKDRLVHYDYNNILPQTNPAWEKAHETSITGAIERYRYNRALFHDVRRDLDAAVNSIVRAINASSAENPLYFVLAGPMQVPFLGIEKSDPAKRKFVYCISHSRWNDGFASGYAFPYNKRAVIPTGIRWVQIGDQNRRLATSPFGRPATDEEWAPWFWMRDSSVENVRFLWDRLRATTRADCSDAGMAYFLVSGDEEGDIAKLRDLLEKRRRPAPLDPRPYVRLEAENFLDLDNYVVEDSNRQASHRLNVRLAGASKGRISGPFDQPYTAVQARYEAQVRYFPEASGACRYTLLVNGRRQGKSWQSAAGQEWQTETFPDITIRTDDTIAVESECEADGTGRLDYVHLIRKP
jgi:hypothetical protein